jgi:hypothetical protein
MKSYNIIQKILNCNACQSVSWVLWSECVFVVVDFWFGGFIEGNRNDIEAEGAVLDTISGEEIAGGAEQPCFLGLCYRILGSGVIRAGLCSYLDEDNGAVGINHDQVKLAGLTGKVAGEGFEAFSFEELFAAFFAPSAEAFPVGQQLLPIQEQICNLAIL